MPLKITKNETTKLVYVLPKFSLVIHLVKFSEVSAFAQLSIENTIFSLVNQVLYSPAIFN